jgi:hypothetical protein
METGRVESEFKQQVPNQPTTPYVRICSVNIYFRDVGISGIINK